MNLFVSFIFFLLFLILYAINDLLIGVRDTCYDNTLGLLQLLTSLIAVIYIYIYVKGA